MRTLHLSPTKNVAAWDPEPLWTFRGREKSPTSAMIRTPGSTARVLIDMPTELSRLLTVR